MPQCGTNPHKTEKACNMKRSMFFLVLAALAAHSCILVPTSGDEIPVDGLIVYYPFNGNVQDLSGNLNHCTDSTDGVFVNCVSGQAKDFNGETDMLKLSFPLKVENGLTFSFWLNSKGVKEGEENGIVISKYDNSVWGRCFIVSTQASWTENNPSLRANFYAYGTTSTYRDCAYSDIMTHEEVPAGLDSSLFTLHHAMTLPLNVWTHCVINVTDTEIEAWINGVLTVSKVREYESYCDSSQYFPGTDIDTYIGNNPKAGLGSNNHYFGAIDELRVYDRALSNEEIIVIYENSR